MALYGHPERMKMGRPSRGRGGAAHAGEREGSPLAQTPSLFRASSAKAMRSLTPSFHGAIARRRGEAISGIRRVFV
jgi:hypothetical protein